MSTPRSPRDRLEHDLPDAARAFDRVQTAPDAWQENQRRLASGRARRHRQWVGAAAAVVVLVLVSGLVLLDGRDPGDPGDLGTPAGGSDGDPWGSGNVLGEPVVAETLTIDGERAEHEVVLTDTTGDGPDLCDRYVTSSSAAGGCTPRQPGADDPSVAVDWISGTEGGGDIRGVVAGVDSRVSFLTVWMSNGDRVPATLHPAGWEGTRMFALTVPADGPRPQRLVATGRDRNVLQAVDLVARFGNTWLTPRYACAGDRVAEYVPDGDVLPNAYVALGTGDARISARLTLDDGADACLESLRSTALAGWYRAGSLAAVVVAPEAAAVRLVVAGGAGGDRVVDEVRPTPVPGSPWRIVMLRARSEAELARAELVALDGFGSFLDRGFVNQPPTP